MAREEKTKIVAEYSTEGDKEYQDSFKKSGEATEQLNAPVEKTTKSLDQLSNEMQAKVDDEIKKIVDKAYKVAVEVLTKHKSELDAVVDRLIEIESLDGDEFTKIVGIKKARLEERESFSKKK